MGINQAEGDTIHILNADLHLSVGTLHRMEGWLHGFAVEGKTDRTDAKR